MEKTNDGDVGGPGSPPGNRGHWIAPQSCDRCNCEMFEFHCRLICPTCGFQRDCSDP